MEQAVPCISLEGDHVLSREELQLALRAVEGQASDLPVSSDCGIGQNKNTKSGVNGREDGPGETIKLSLENKNLWKQFYGIPNEMIVTKIGRRMFPLLQVTICGLDPAIKYAILLEFQLTDNHRWRFLNGEWTPAGSVSIERPQPSSIYVHTSSPLTGREWMMQQVTFSKVKLSNKEDGIGKVKLTSLYRYQPCIHIVQLDQHREHVVAQPEASSLPSSIIASQVFTETQFIAVTAYQNDKITQMKIKHNPFAKAFLGSQDTNAPTRPLPTDDALASSSTLSTQSASYLQFQTPSLQPSTVPHLHHHNSEFESLSMVVLPSLSPTKTMPLYTMSCSSQIWPLQSPFQAAWNGSATLAAPLPLHRTTSMKTTGNQECLMGTGITDYTQQPMLSTKQQNPGMLQYPVVGHQQMVCHQLQQKQHDPCNVHQLFPTATCAANVPTPHVVVPHSEETLKELGSNEPKDVNYQPFKQLSTNLPSFSDHNTSQC